MWLLIVKDALARSNQEVRLLQHTQTALQCDVEARESDISDVKRQITALIADVDQRDARYNSRKRYRKLTYRILNQTRSIAEQANQIEHYIRVIDQLQDDIRALTKEV